MITVGVALGRSDVVHIDDKRAVALEDVLIIFQFLNHSRQCSVKFGAHRLVVFQIADRDIVLLRLDIQQVVDGNREIVSPDSGVVDGDADVFLLLRRVAQQRLHFFSQKPVVPCDDRHSRHEETDHQRPVQEQEKCLKGDRNMKEERERQEVAYGNEEDQAE